MRVNEPTPYATAANTATTATAMPTRFTSVRRLTPGENSSPRA